jgi:hypothetical protein
MITPLFILQPVLISHFIIISYVWSVILFCCFMLYRDLLNKDQTKKYELRENTDIGVYVKDLSSFVCKSGKEIEQVMFIGNQNRKIGYVSNACSTLSEGCQPE